MGQFVSRQLSSAVSVLVFVFYGRHFSRIDYPGNPGGVDVFRTNKDSAYGAIPWAMLPLKRKVGLFDSPLPTEQEGAPSTRRSTGSPPQAPPDEIIEKGNSRHRLSTQGHQEK